MVFSFGICCKLLYAGQTCLHHVCIMLPCQVALALLCGKLVSVAGRLMLRPVSIRRTLLESSGGPTVHEVMTTTGILHIRPIKGRSPVPKQMAGKSGAAAADSLAPISVVMVPAFQRAALDHATSSCAERPQVQELVTFGSESRCVTATCCVCARLCSQ